MSSVINTNVASLNAQRNLASSQSGLATSLQRLSSGMRINSAKDDAAGMSISSRMSSQISGVQQAGRNANDGISLAQTAEGGLQNISDSLQRMRDLAVQSSNATNSASDRAAIQNEVGALVAQINTVSSQSSFNGTKLLDGSFTSQSFQVGANAGETITIASIGSAKADALGVGVGGASYQATVGGTAISGSLAANGITVNGYNVGPSYSDGVSTAGSNDSAIAKASAFNAVSGQTGVTAKAGSTSVIGSAASAGAIVSGSVFVNNVDIGAVTAGTNAVSQANNVTAAINAVSSRTGVTATFSTSTNAITLNAADGRNIGLYTTGAGGQTATGFSSTQMTNGASTVSFAGAGAATGFSAIAAGDLTVNGLDIGAVAAGSNATTQGANVAAAINALTSKTGVTATNAAGTLTLTSTNAGQSISLSGSSTNATSTATRTGFSVAQLDTNTASVTRGTVTLTSTSSSSSASGSITVGGSDVARSGLTQANTVAALTASTSGVDVSTAAGAQSAIATIDAALATLNTNRANLGAIQNRFSSIVNNLAATSENLSASRSRIQDADFAVETANLTHGQILQQAGTAMLSQANSLPQGVLALLK